jgi:hypothetical protein
MSILQHLPLLPSPSPPSADPSDSNLSRSSLDHAPPPHPPPSHPLVSFLPSKSFDVFIKFSRSNSTQPSLSRTRTILKFLTPKIRLTIPVLHLSSPPSPTSPEGNNTTLFAPRAPTPLDSQSAKEKRLAALRERGLLPPLQNKDLSRQELEEDKRLPIAAPVEKTAVTITSSTGIEMVSAADLIKMEWEAKNRSGKDDERDRFKSFKFGASLPLLESEVSRPSQQDVACQEPSFGSQLWQDDLGCSSDTPQIVVSGSAGRSQNSTQRDHELGQLSPALIPLPPSPPPTPPASPKLGTNLKLVSPGAIDLCSPALVPLTPPSSEPTAKHGADETNLELVISIPTGPATPLISLSPVTEDLEPKEKDAQGHQRKVSVSDSSQSSSLATPSLETPSHSTAMSILGTAESSPRIKTIMLIGGKNIPMIVESPLEEGPAPELAIPNTIPEDSDGEAQLDDYQKPKPRRKKQTLLFGQDPSKRLRVSASLTNMRRSVANTLSRTRSQLTVKGTKHDNTPNVLLPPSSTFPLTGSTGVDMSMEGVATSTPRQPVSPTLHSHGSILLETSAIEDDEARRMTELAFLG